MTQKKLVGFEHQVLELPRIPPFLFLSTFLPGKKVELKNVNE